VFGEPTEQILRIAEETKAQLIVMGATPRKSPAGNVSYTYSFCIIDPDEDAPNNRATLILLRITGVENAFNLVWLTLSNKYTSSS
jgi:nucleotide-binding universal stress UspA family protein